MKKTEIEICPNCKERIHPSDYPTHADGNRGMQISHFCGYHGVPILMNKEKFKRMKRMKEY